MKRIVLLTVSLCLLSCLLCGCFSGVMVIPNNDSIGEPQNFEKDGLTITLTDRFKEEQSRRGFDAYFVADFCGVVVLKEEFTLEEGLSERPLEEYITNVIANNGYTDITPQAKDGLWFYETSSNGRYKVSYCYKGSDAFWIVQFICNQSDAPMLKNMFYLWALSVEVK